MPEWLLPILIGAVIVGLAGAVWRAHERRDQERFDDIWNQLGRDSEHGMRKTVHRTANEMSWVSPELEDLKERVERLERKEDER
jgi:hypothetical protein